MKGQPRGNRDRTGQKGMGGAAGKGKEAGSREAHAEPPGGPWGPGQGQCSGFQRTGAWLGGGWAWGGSQLTF